MPNRPVTITRRRALIVLLVLTGVYVVQGTVLGCAIRSNRHLAREGQQAHDATCARKRSIVGRVTDTWKFLDSGKTIPGVSDTLILRGISRDIEEFDSLAAVTCDPPVASPRRPKEK